MVHPDARSDWQRELLDREAHGRLRTLTVVTSLGAHRVLAGGHRRLNLASNDYLGLGCDAAAQRSFLASLAGADPLSEAGFAASASRLLSGEHPAYAALEAALEATYGPGRRALVLNSGYHANIGILPALAGKGDLILSDRLNHASLLDGIRLSRAAWVRYRHGDVEHLRELLASRRAAARRAFIVTESLFSMDGDCADLRALVETKQEFDAILYVDEAHAVGVRGPRGLGLCSEAGVLGDVDILVGTFGKALASTGAFVICDTLIRDVLVNAMRSLIYTTALPPIVVNWSRHALELALAADDRRRDLARNTERLRGALARCGLPTLGDTHIVPVVTGGDRAATRLAARLRDLGFLAPAIRPPTVPEGTARLRLSLGAGMSAEDLDALAARIAENWEDPA